MSATRGHHTWEPHSPCKRDHSCGSHVPPVSMTTACGSHVPLVHVATMYGNHGPPASVTATCGRHWFPPTSCLLARGPRACTRDPALPEAPARPPRPATTRSRQHCREQSQCAARRGPLAVCSCSFQVLNMQNTEQPCAGPPPGIQSVRQRVPSPPAAFAQTWRPHGGLCLHECAPRWGVWVTAPLQVRR